MSSSNATGRNPGIRATKGAAKLVRMPARQPASRRQRQRGLVAEGQGTLAAALAEHQEDIQVELDIRQLEADQFPTAGAGVEQEHDEDGVSTSLEALPFADLQGRRRPSPGITGRVVGDDGRFHLGHRARDVFLLLEPPVEDSEHPRSCQA
jgi:hypothetical protein